MHIITKQKLKALAICSDALRSTCQESCLMLLLASSGTRSNPAPCTQDVAGRCSVSLAGTYRCVTCRPGGDSVYLMTAGDVVPGGAPSTGHGIHRRTWSGMQTSPPSCPWQTQQCLEMLVVAGRSESSMCGRYGRASLSVQTVARRTQCVGCECSES